MSDIITHIEDDAEHYSLTQKNAFSEFEDDIPEDELLRMLEEVKKEVKVKPRKKKEYKYKGKDPGALTFMEPERSLDKRFCKGCYRKFMDIDLKLILSDGDFPIVAEELD
jgi:hypothetical protein